MELYSERNMHVAAPLLNRFFACTLIVLSSTALLGAQNSTSSSPPSLPGSFLQGSQSPFSGSEPEGKATADVLPLSFQDAIDRGLRNNLGLLISGDQALTARGERWKELSNLLPNLQARLQEDVQTQSLAALGFRGNLFPFPLPRIIGPYNYFDLRASLSQSVFNFRDLEQERAASERLKSAQYSYKDARELVVLAVGNAYLLAIASAARIETTDAQVQNALALFNKATDQQKAGLSPAIDTLRSQVELQTRQQQLIAARNDFAKQKLSLARIIGLPPGQEFVPHRESPLRSSHSTSDRSVPPARLYLPIGLPVRAVAAPGGGVSRRPLPPAAIRL